MKPITFSYSLEMFFFFQPFFYHVPFYHLKCLEVALFFEWHTFQQSASWYLFYQGSSFSARISFFHSFNVRRSASDSWTSISRLSPADNLTSKLVEPP